MPNIELHGYDTECARVVRDRIVAVLKTYPEAHEVVTTTHLSRVEDLEGKQLPFLRLISSSNELPKLLPLLKQVGEDIEVILLGEWIPKTK